MSGPSIPPAVRAFAAALGFSVIAIILFSTLSPISLRPKTGHPDLERFAAFFLAGGCLTIAYPRRPFVVGVALVLGACLAEAAQLLAPGRDARVHDAVVKASGGVIGLALAAVATRRASSSLPRA
ncbi:MAG: hypothetical protein WA840_08230 [Caulobacteraceae bacterium]